MTQFRPSEVALGPGGHPGVAYAHLKAYEARRAREMTIPAPRGLNLILELVRERVSNDLPAIIRETGNQFLGDLSCIPN